MPIVPIKYLEPLAALSTNQMVLAHLVQHNEEYLEFYKNRSDKGDFILLDNGAYELGESLSVNELLEVYNKLGRCNAIVVPDTEKGDNIELFNDTINIIKANVHESCSIIAVPHEEEDIEIMINNEYVDTIGLNRINRNRVAVVKKYKGNGKLFHFLGFHKDPIRELKNMVDYKDVITSIDSSLPFRLFKRGSKVHEVLPHPPSIDFDAELEPDWLLNHCKIEMSNFIKWVEEL